MISVLLTILLTFKLRKISNFKIGGETYVLKQYAYGKNIIKTCHFFFFCKYYLAIARPFGNYCDYCGRSQKKKKKNEIKAARRFWET